MGHVAQLGIPRGFAYGIALCFMAVYTVLIRGGVSYLRLICNILI